MKGKGKRYIWINLLLVITMIGILSPTTFAEVLNEGGVKVTRTAKEIPGQKNTWEMEIKLEGQNLLRNSKTDVVLVLDRSGSMKNNNRAGLVKDASEQLVTDLVKQDNVNVAIVSFGGGIVTNRWGESYEHYKKGTWTSFNNIYYDNQYYDTYYTNVIMEKGLTRDLPDLKMGINSALNRPIGGTPVSLGIIKAGLMLENSEAANKVIILLSDGEPTIARDGSGTGNSVTDDVQNDTQNAALQAKSKGIKLYTIAAGNDITPIGKTILENCSSGSEYSYAAGDSVSALKGVMSNISLDIKDMIKETFLLDQINENFQIDVDSKLDKKGIELIDYNALKTTTINWAQTNVVITQGDIETLKTREIKWNIGEIKQGVPAIIRYRVEMTDGDIGKEYEVSKSTQLSYTDIKGNSVQSDIQNIQLKALWVKLVLNYLDNAGNIILDETHRSYADEAWYKLGDDLSKIVVNPQITVNKNNKEICPNEDYNLKPDSNSTNVTLRRLNIIKGYDFIGSKGDVGMLNRNLEVEVTKVQQPINFYYKTYSGCNCSTVLGRVTAFVNARRADQVMFYQKQKYSQGEINDDFREGIWNAIVSGSEYEKQLAKYEIYMLLTHYPNIEKMAGKTPTQWIQELDNKLNATGPNSQIEAANFFNNNLKMLIDFKKEKIGVDDYKDILLTLGIEGVDNKSMNDIEKQLKHEHKKISGVDPRPCDEEEDKLAACSKVNQPPENVVNVPTGGCTQSIIGRITNGETIYAPTEGVHIGVADGIVAECTCRLEVNVITPLPAQSPDAIGGSRNIIQPEALTNIAAEVEFKETSRDVSFSMDLSSLINEKMGTHEIMSFDLSNAVAYIKKTNASSPIILVKDTDYTISPSGNIVTITFTAPSSRADQCSVEAGDKYQFNLYVPTHMKDEIVYKNYLNQYSNISKTNTVSCKLVSTPRQRMRDHVFIDPPQFGAPLIVQKNITLIYYPIATIN